VENRIKINNNSWPDAEKPAKKAHGCGRGVLWDVLRRALLKRGNGGHNRGAFAAVHLHQALKRGGGFGWDKGVQSFPSRRQFRRVGGSGIPGAGRPAGWGLGVHLELYLLITSDALKQTTAGGMLSSDSHLAQIDGETPKNSAQRLFVHTARPPRL